MVKCCWELARKLIKNICYYFSVRLPPNIVGSPLREEDCPPGQPDCVLKYFDTEEDITLKCDASGTPDPK